MYFVSIMFCYWFKCYFFVFAALHSSDTLAYVFVCWGNIIFIRIFLHSHFVELSVFPCMFLQAFDFFHLRFFSVDRMLQLVYNQCNRSLFLRRVHLDQTEWCYHWSDNVTRVLTVIFSTSTEYIYSASEWLFHFYSSLFLQFFLLFFSSVGYGTCKAI